MSDVSGRHTILGAAGIDALALGLYLASAGVFLHEVIGLSSGAVGLVLGVGGAASMIGAVPVARLADRFSGPSVLAILFVVRGAAFLLFALAQEPVMAIIAVTAAGFLSRGIGPILQSIGLEGRGSAESVRILASIRAIRNAGIALGGVPVGFVLAADSSLGFRVMVGVAGAIAGGAALLALALPATSPSSRPVTPSKARVDGDFIALTVVYGFLTMSGIVLGLGLPLLIVQHADIPRWTVGGIQVGNTVMVVALQVIFSRGSERIARARGMLVTGGLISAVATTLLWPLSASAGAASVAMVAVCIVVFTVAELLASAGGSGIMLSFVPEGERARYLAVYNLGFAGASIVGPPIVGFAAAADPRAWLGVAALFVVVAAAASRLRAGPYAHAAAPESQQA